MKDDQGQVVAFLASPEAYVGGGTVEIVETHGAYVFLCGGSALKLKRAVKYDYMDLSTAEKRRSMLERELELNLPVAPSIYIDVQPVTRGPDGKFSIGGPGDPVDWVLRMNRYPGEDELTAVAERGELDDHLATQVGTALAAYHAAAPVRRRPGAPLIAAILEELGRVFAEYDGVDGTARFPDWLSKARDTLSRIAPVLDARGMSGHVKRAHGDLHLRNIVLLDGRPVPLDALEFDETLGTCDVLYDLGFLVMDLCHRGLDSAACRVLDAWLTEFRGDEDPGLAGLPLFLSVRAAIRAMVLLQTDAARGTPGQSAGETALYLRQAHRFLEPKLPVLVAVGGYSGTGKSVVSRGVSPGLGVAPGAVILSSDAIRKAGRAPGDRLSADAYAEEARNAVYDTIFERARAILACGHSVVLDATFLNPELRVAAENTAKKQGVSFAGFWLQASVDVLETRIKKRTRDVSDADVGVLRAQLAGNTGTIGWTMLDASRDQKELIPEVRSLLAMGVT